MSSPLQSLLEGKIDFEGQKAVDEIHRYALVAITIVSFLAGFSAQSLQLAFAIFAGLTLVLALVVVPPWPMYNRHPVQWAPTKETKKTQ